MDFTVYDISSYDEIDGDDYESLEELESLIDNSQLEELEMGLSAGEIRQSLLDRIRQEVRKGELRFLNKTISPLELQIADELAETESGRKAIVNDLETILYELGDKDIVGTVWEFSSEKIYVGGN